LKGVAPNSPDVERNVTRRRLLGAGAVAALTGLAGCSGATPYIGKRTENERALRVRDATSLAVTAKVGTVSLVGEERDDIHLDLVKKASSVSADLSKLTLDVQRNNGRLHLQSRFEGDEPFFGGRPTMDLALRVPRSLAVEHVDSSVGDVTLRGVAGDMTVTTDVGDVHVQDVRGVVSAEASTGDIVVESGETVGDVSASTGDLDLAVSAIDGDTEFTTSTGDIVLALSTDVTADLTAEADVGDVTVEGLSLEDSQRQESMVTGRLNGGGPELTVSTNTGDISVSSLNSSGE
jgi:DUF4097 and DUF4098 domain-containing protein YvlB